MKERRKEGKEEGRKEGWMDNLWFIFSLPVK
jgi:hypothetical protein